MLGQKERCKYKKVGRLDFNAGDALVPNKIHGGPAHPCTGRLPSVRVGRTRSPVVRTDNEARSVSQQAGSLAQLLQKEVLGGGLEPPCLAAYAPQTYVSAISPPERKDAWRRYDYHGARFRQAIFVRGGVGDHGDAPANWPGGFLVRGLLSPLHGLNPLS